MVERLAAHRIPLADPRRDLAPVQAEIAAAVLRVIESGHYILGPAVEFFERSMAARLATPGTVGVASGTDAIVLAMLAFGIGPGDEVITVSHTAGPTVAAIRMTGATPVLVDVEPTTFCLDPSRLDEAVGPRTKAILPVHLYGHPADMAAICAFAALRGIAVIEDCAQAQEATLDGRMVGSIGDVACFSFYPTKNLGALGDGGLVTAREPRVIEKLRQLRLYGWAKPQFAEIVDGRCSRLDELQAAILSVKLDRLADDIERRRSIAEAYRRGLSDLPLKLPSERVGSRHAYHLYVVRSDRRDALAQHLDAAGIGTGRHYPFPVHRQPAFAGSARIAGSLDVTETLADEILTLPLFPSLSTDEVARVVSSVRAFFLS